jgi:hypothetical protein
MLQVMKEMFICNVKWLLIGILVTVVTIVVLFFFSRKDGGLYVLLVFLFIPAFPLFFLIGMIRSGWILAACTRLRDFLVAQTIYILIMYSITYFLMLRFTVVRDASLLQLGCVLIYLCGFVSFCLSRKNWRKQKKIS